MIRSPGIAPSATAIGPPSPTARRLVAASVSTNTRRAYAGALGQLDAWLAGQKLDDAALAAYLAALHDAGRPSSSTAMAVRRGAVPRPARRPSGRPSASCWRSTLGTSPDFSQLPEIGHEAVGLGFRAANSGASGGLDAGDDVRAAPKSVG